jgi:hypothetical protein
MHWGAYVRGWVSKSAGRSTSKLDQASKVMPTVEVTVEVTLIRASGH